MNKQLVHYAGNTTNGANYTWCAATAGTCSGATTIGATAGSSICPRGWKLPTRAQYDALKSKDGGWNSSKKGRTLSGGFFPAAGYVDDGSLIYVGSVGDYWSSTANGAVYAYRLDFGSSNVYTNNGNPYRGFSVRCIAP